MAAPAKALTVKDIKRLLFGLHNCQNLELMRRIMQSPEGQRPLELTPMEIDTLVAHIRHKYRGHEAGKHVCKSTRRCANCWHNLRRVLVPH